ncbi:MAG: squalene--hopene cyclase, partial [Candidatus Binatia bacterium]
SMSNGEGQLVLVEEHERGAALAPRVSESIAAATRYLVGIQHPHGYWHAPLEANVTMESQFVFFNRLTDRQRPDLDRKMVERLLALQQPDGSWPLYFGGPGHVSVTIEAYLALKLGGLRASEPALARAREFILGHGGLARAGIFTRIWLSFFGQYPAAGIPNMPIELMLMPPWFPLNIYAMSSWARETVVPILLLMTNPPRAQLAPEEGVSELWLRPPRDEDVRFRRSPELVSWANVFLAADWALTELGKSPWKPLRRRAVARAIEWILRRQDSTGQWGGIQPPMLNCVLALTQMGFAADHPVVMRGIQGIDDFLIQCDGTLMYQPCVSPNWDTALSLKALLDAGVEPSHPALGRAADWLVSHQIFRSGDWSVYNPRLEPGGWAFEFANDWYPDVDDSAVILMGMTQLPCAQTPAGKRSVAYGLNWTLGMQSRSGGYAAFDVDNTRAFWNEIPFADMKAMIDPPTEDVTGRMLELMGRVGYDAAFGRARRALDFVRRTQRADGSWWGRWGVNFIYGTWSVLAGLESIGEDMTAPYVRKAADWLRSHQNADGGWGETVASYDDESLAGRGESTPSQTAWAVMGLLAAEGTSAAARHGVDWLLRMQGEDGTWEEKPWTGTGFPRHFYLRYHLYRHYFPLMALGQYRAELEGARASALSTEGAA